MKTGTIVVEMRSGKTLVASSGHEDDARTIALLIGANPSVLRVLVDGILICGPLGELLDADAASAA